MAAPVKISLTKRPVASSLVRVDPSQQAPFNIRGRGALKAKTFECSFCEETFSAENFLDDHLSDFHRISRKKVGVQSRATMVSQKGPTSRSVGHLGEDARSAKKPTSSRKSGSVRSPDKKANLHQCYVCALEFKSESILNLHLEKVHLIGGAQTLVEKETKPQNFETPAEVNGEIFD